MIRELKNRIANLASRGTVTLADAAGKMQRLQISLLDGERKSNLEHFEPHGFTSNPMPGAEVLPIFLEGDRSHGIALVVADRRYRIRGLPGGSVALGFDGGSVVVNLDGSITITATSLDIQADTITSSGDWTHTGELKANGVSLPSHVHAETGGITDPPTPA